MTRDRKTYYSISGGNGGRIGGSWLLKIWTGGIDNRTGAGSSWHMTEQEAVERVKSWHSRKAVRGPA